MSSSLIIMYKGIYLLFAIFTCLHSQSLDVVPMLKYEYESDSGFVASGMPKGGKRGELYVGQRVEQAVPSPFSSVVGDSE